MGLGLVPGEGTSVYILNAASLAGNKSLLYIPSANNLILLR
jgi:hypothetical protein